MKNYFILLISCFIFSLSAYIVEYCVFYKDNAPEIHLLFDIHTEDKEDLMYPMEKQHKDEFLTFISTHAHNNKVVVEDLEALSLDKNMFDLHSNMLDWLSNACQKKGAHTVNVDCRPVFAAARNIIDARIHFVEEACKKTMSSEALSRVYAKLDQLKIPLSKIYKEFDENRADIKRFQGNKILSHYFGKQLAILVDRFNKTLGLLNDTDKTLYENIVAQFKTKKERKSFVDTLDTIDNEFVDMKALIEIYKAHQENKEKVFVILGASHSHNISNVLPLLDYKKVWSTAQLNTEVDYTDYHHQKAINLIEALHHKKRSCWDQLKSFFVNCKMLLKKIK